MPIQQLPSTWGDLGDAFQAILQNAMMLFMLKKFYPELFEKKAKTMTKPERPLTPFLRNLPQMAPGFSEWQNISYFPLNLPQFPILPFRF